MECRSNRTSGTAYIALGSNLDDPKAQLLRAFDDLNALPQTRLIARSSLYLSAPVGYLEQPPFVNGVAAVETGLPPHRLLDALLALEQRRGRVRDRRHGPRTLDLDVLLYDELQCHEHGLTLPHPRMHERAFVLLPLLEIAPACVVPGLGPAARWLEGCAAQAIERLP